MDQEMNRYLLYSPMESVESHINVLSSYDFLLAQKGYLLNAFVKELNFEPLSIRNTQMDGKTKTRNYVKKKNILS